MSTAAQHLPTIGPSGVTFEEANDFIFSHLDQPQVIFDISKQYGVTVSMLAEISGHSADEVMAYFSNAALDAKELDKVSSLVNYDLGSLAHFVDFDNNAGTLSTASLQAIVREKFKVNPADYDDFFTPLWSSHVVDHVFTPDELGVTHLGNILHPGEVFEKNEGLESVFYGTLLNIFKAFDQTELNQIENFTHTDTNGNEFQALLVEALSDSPSPSVWTDEELSGHVTAYAGGIIEDYWNDPSVSGILDLSYVALAVA
jgi:hypothetical protein